LFIERYIELLRPSNFVITVMSVFVSCLLAGGDAGHTPAMILASLAAGLIGGGGMVINDIFDVGIDRINKPERPLPRGAVTLRSAAVFYALLTSVGLLLNLFLHSVAQVIAAGAVVLIFFYSYRLKSTPLFGNVTVGLLTGLAFIYGGAAVGNIDRAIIPAIFALLINIGRELIKDMEDVEGDALHHASTFPVKFGMRPALVVATLFLLAVVGSTIVPFADHQYGVLYFVIVFVGVDCVVAFVLLSMWKNSSPKNLNKLSVILKYDMLIGLIAIYLS